MLQYGGLWSRAVAGSGFMINGGPHADGKEKEVTAQPTTSKISSKTQAKRSEKAVSLSAAFSSRDVADGVFNGGPHADDKEEVTAPEVESMGLSDRQQGIEFRPDACFLQHLPGCGVRNVLPQI
jgi:hypothetical protein